MKKLAYILSLSFSLALSWACTKDSFSGGEASTGRGGSLARFALAADHLYTVDNTTLHVFSLQNPDSPQLIKSQLLGFGIETIFPYGDKLFLGAMDGMYIIDIATPESPQVLSVYRHVMSCDPVVVRGNYAYVTLRDGTECRQGINALEVIDISNLESPRLLQTYPMTNPKGLGIDEDKLFVCDGVLKILSVNPQNPAELSPLRQVSMPNAFDVIAWNGRLLLIAEDGLYQYRYQQDQWDFISKIAVGR